jgi:hypothetical protein
MIQMQTNLLLGTILHCFGLPQKNLPVSGLGQNQLEGTKLQMFLMSTNTPFCCKKTPYCTHNQLILPAFVELEP